MSYNQASTTEFDKGTHQPVVEPPADLFYTSGMEPSSPGSLILSNDSPRSLSFSMGDQQPRRPKRKRKAKSRKGLEKVFACDEEGCDKKFTRSEHLARHKLNHSPKQVFNCTWPDCDKSFVREDLRARHIERHMKRQEADGKPKPIIQVEMNVQQYSPNEREVRELQTTYTVNTNDSVVHPNISHWHIPNNDVSTPPVSSTSPRSSNQQYPNQYNQYKRQQTASNNIQPQNRNPLPEQLAGPTNHLQPQQIAPTQRQPAPRVQSPPSPIEPVLRPPSRSPLLSLPGFQHLVSSERWPGGPGENGGAPSNGVGSPNGLEINSLLTPAATEPTSVTNHNKPTTVKTLTSNAPSSSYFYSNVYTPRETAVFSPSSPHHSSMSTGASSIYSGHGQAVPSAPSLNRLYNGSIPGSGLSPTSAELIDWYFSDSMFLGSRDFFASSNAPSYYELPLVDFSQLSTPPSFSQAQLISESKRDQLINLIPALDSVVDFTLENINHYLELYWKYFHIQFPILHKISFEAENASPHLLLSMLLIGATYGEARDLAMAIAEPFRWIIFSSPGFHPPTKLPILQSLLLLEVYEKIMSTRKLHERAHIHHGATLQLIRRGSTLLNPAYAFSTQGGDAGSTWRKWVEAESIKRAVFMAFILDVMHSILFSHGLLMGAHEMKLSLPCDDRIWNSANDERSKLTSNPPILFLEALKKILNLQPVGVTGFASQALQTGILSIAIQMSQQAQHISSIGWGSFRDTWKSILVRSFDFEYQDYLNAMAGQEREDEILRQRVDLITNDSRSMMSGSGRSVTGDEDDVSTSGKTFDPEGYIYANNHPVAETTYHMLQICIRVARYDLHVFCGDRRILGRASHRDDFFSAKKYIYQWVKTAAAREAAFHAIRALYCIFINGDKPNDQFNLSGSESSAHAAGYNVTQDIFVHRPMMIVHCTMVFWAYAYCLEGPESNLMAGVNESPSSPQSKQMKDHEWAMAAESGRSFIERMNRAQTPAQLELVQNKNRTVGLLKWVILSLKESKWFALQEMCDILDDCVQRSLGRVEYVEPSDDDEKAPSAVVGY